MIKCFVSLQYRMNILKKTGMGKYFGRGPGDKYAVMSNDGSQGMSKADRVLGRTPGSDDGSREFHSSSKAERMLGIGQYDPDNNMSKADRVLGRRPSDDRSKADRILGRGGSTKRCGGRKRKATRKNRRKSARRARK
jgi:hypothetical protein